MWRKNVNQEEFKALYQGNFQPDAKEKKLYELAERYHETTEAFDQLICKCRTKDGTAIPLTLDERLSTGQYAKATMKQCIEEGKDFGLTEEEIRSAVRVFIRNMEG